MLSYFSTYIHTVLTTAIYISLISFIYYIRAIIYLRGTYSVDNCNIKMLSCFIALHSTFLLSFASQSVVCCYCMVYAIPLFKKFPFPLIFFFILSPYSRSFNSLTSIYSNVYATFGIYTHSLLSDPK